MRWHSFLIASHGHCAPLRDPSEVGVLGREPDSEPDSGIQAILAELWIGDLVRDMVVLQSDWGRSWAFHMGIGQNSTTGPPDCRF